MAVLVLDTHKQPLISCSEKRARLLLQRRRAVVHRRVPFTIRLKDRRQDLCQLQPVVLKLDPGSRTTGIALARVAHTEDGEVHHALHLAELSHRGEAVHHALLQRAGYRRRRQSANLRYRPPRRTGSSTSHWLISSGQGDGINARYCRILQRGDGYTYSWV